MDTLERITNDASALSGQYMSTFHEGEYSADGSDNVWDTPAGRGRNGITIPNTVTDEGVKILPNNLFTPGTHIEYFFRRTFVTELTAFSMMPDTNSIYPQTLFGSGNFDGIRYGSWDALPDRWKDPSFPGNAGTPTACMLVANFGSRRGDGVLWDNMARAIGLTRPAKWGAGGHGYYSSATGDIPAFTSDPAAQPANGGGVVSANLGHEGSLYDFYDVVAGESNVPAGRLGNRIALGTCTGAQTGMCATSGPTPKMLRYYYSNLIVLGADLGSTTWGPFIDQSDNDIGLFTDFIQPGWCRWREWRSAVHEHDELRYRLGPRRPGEHGELPAELLRRDVPQ
jgi:hypothetical protein